jgi:hypothetical protein
MSDSTSPQKDRPLSVVAFLLVSLMMVALLVACQSNQPGTAPGLWSEDGPSDNPYEDGAVMPADHSVDWMRRHGAMALGQGADCAVCHGEQDCVQCHVESLDTAYAVHPPNYAVVHSVDARQGLMDCTSCHRLDTFCQACHAESGVSPDVEYGPPAGMEFHPPDWLDPMAPENHGTMARRDIMDCASCHIEQDCISCHVGINPHPPEFRFDCDRLLDVDPTACTQCHIESADELRHLCL